MANYQYTVTGMGCPMSSEDQSPDDAQAARQAVIFLSELLRDSAISKRDGSTIKVEVHRSNGSLLCEASAAVTLHTDRQIDKPLRRKRSSNSRRQSG